MAEMSELERNIYDQNRKQQPHKKTNTLQDQITEITDFLDKVTPDWRSYSPVNPEAEALGEVTVKKGIGPVSTLPEFPDPLPNVPAVEPGPDLTESEAVEDEPITSDDSGTVQ